MFFECANNRNHEQRGPTVFVNYKNSNNIEFVNSHSNAVVIFDENSELLTPDESNLRNPVNSANPGNPINLINPVNQGNPINLVNPVNPALTMMDPQTFTQLQDLMRQRHKLQLIQQQIDIIRQNQLGKYYGPHLVLN